MNSWPGVGRDNAEENTRPLGLGLCGAGVEMQARHDVRNGLGST